MRRKLIISVLLCGLIFVSLAFASAAIADVTRQRISAAAFRPINSTYFSRSQISGYNMESRGGSSYYSAVIPRDKPDSTLVRVYVELQHDENAPSRCIAYTMSADHSSSANSGWVYTSGTDFRDNITLTVSPAISGGNISVYCYIPDDDDYNAGIWNALVYEYY